MEPYEPHQRELDKARLKEVQERAAKTVAPPLPPDRIHDIYGPLPGGGPKVVVLPDPPRRTAGGDVPSELIISEADRLRDPAYKIATLEQRIAALEGGNAELRLEVAAIELSNAELRREFAEIKGMLLRYFGEAAQTDGGVYR